MMRTVLVGLWICIVAAASSVATGWYELRPVSSSLASQANTEYRKMDAVSVPKIADGTLQGYVVVRFGLTLDSKLAKEQKISPEILVFEDAFRVLYSDKNLDFKHLDAYDIDALVKRLAKDVNQRLKVEVVKNVAVEEFNYLSKAELNK